MSRDPFRNYDAWKLASPPEYDAPEPEMREISECCGARRDPRDETDSCPHCKEHCTFEEVAVEPDYDGPDEPPERDR